ncbi:Dynactin [Pseudozyma hubeiensis]|nr:Dynactin [Pseudozyma hubeiensis]
MSAYGGGRDPYHRDGPSRDPRARSRSPPPRPYQERDRVAARINRMDHDAPAQSLQRKPGASANPTSGNPTSGYPLNHASTSASTLDRNAPTSRAQASDRSESSAAARRNSSALTEPAADLVARLYASVPERQLFDQIFLKSFVISEDRRTLEDQHKKLKSVQDWLNKAGSKDPKNLARLTEQQQTVARLQQKINSDSDDLYRMQLRWQVDLNAQIMPSLLASFTAPLEARLQDLSQKVRIEREKDHKRHDELDQQARTLSGQSGRFQSDITKIKYDVAALYKDKDRLHNEITDTRKELRKDVDKDVKQISDNCARIKRLEQKVDAFVESSPRPCSVQPISTASASARAPSTTPSSPGAASVARPRATSPAHDSRHRPAPQSASAAKVVSSSTAVVNGSSAQDGSSFASGSKPVTQAQFRKWMANNEQDIALRLDEMKDIAVQEATAENQSCMEQRLRALARAWKKKALEGDDATDDQDQAAPNANIAESTAAAGATTATADGVTPMDVETVVPHEQQQANSNTLPTGPNGAAPPTSLQPDATVVVDVSTADATSQASPVAAATSDQAKTGTDSEASAARPGSAPATTQSASSGLTQPTDLRQSSAEKGKDIKTQIVTMPAAIVKDMRLSLQDCQSRLATVEQVIDSLRSIESEWVARLIESPDKLQQLLTALKDNGLGNVAENAQIALVRLGSEVVTIQSGMEIIRSTEDESKARISAVEERGQQIIDIVNEKVNYLQRQFEALDDQAALQGALLVRLCEHANPRKSQPRAITATSGNSSQAVRTTQSPAVQSPLVQHAQHVQSPVLRQDHQPQPQAHLAAGQHQQSTLSGAMMRPRASLDQVATALSAHMHPMPYAQPHAQQTLLNSAQAQPYQQAQQQAQQQQQQQQQQHTSFTVPRVVYPYPDPNQRQGFH